MVVIGERYEEKEKSFSFSMEKKILSSSSSR